MLLTLLVTPGVSLAGCTSQSEDTRIPEVNLWIVIQSNEGAGLTDVVPGTELSLQLGADAIGTGSAGCNNFSGGYEIDDNTITFGPLSTTSKACPSPDGVMEQENTYFSALDNTANYVIVGNKMKFTEAIENVLIEFETEGDF